MASLPFVVQPKRQPIVQQIGSEESGVIEIERRGYLTAGEKSFVQQVQQYDNGTGQIITISRHVAREYGLGMDKAYNMVLSIISGSQGSPESSELVNKIETEFAQELTDVVKGLAASQAREDLVYASCLIKYRINPDFEISQISEIHPDIIQGLAALYRDEEARSIEAWQADQPAQDEQPVASVEEAEKKPVKSNTSRSKNTTGD
jgi:hypothetical protein